MADIEARRTQINQAMVGMSERAQLTIGDSSAPEIAVFDINDISYYPARPMHEYDWTAKYWGNQYNAQRPFPHSPTEGVLVVFKDQDTGDYRAELNVERIKPTHNDVIDESIIPYKAFAPHNHEIRSCKSTDREGHFYTTDETGSHWSIHVNLMQPEESEA